MTGSLSGAGIERVPLGASAGSARVANTASERDFGARQGQRGGEARLRDPHARERRPREAGCCRSGPSR